MSRTRKIRPTANEKVLGFNEALELMRIDGHFLMLMHSNRRRFDANEPVGQAYYIVPDGGYLNARDAKKIIERPDVVPGGDGLFKGISQSWRMGIR